MNAIKPFAGSLVLTMAAGALSAASHTDRWAPGAHDRSWDKITALQAFQGGASSFDWKTLVSDRDPLVRAATAAALGRAGGAQATVLALLADDPAPLVRSTAVWALLQGRDKSALLSALRRIDEPVYVHPDLFWRVGLPHGLGGQTAEERREWLRLFDVERWNPSPASCANGNGSNIDGVRVRFSTERSEWDADATVTLRAEVDDPPCGDITLAFQLDGLWSEVDIVSGGFFERTAEYQRAVPRLRTADGAAELRVRRAHGGVIQLLLMGDPAVRPGVYVLQGISTANPLFFRVRRTAPFEQQKPALLERANEHGVAVRLGEQRVLAAASLMLPQWRALETQPSKTSADWERRNAILRALARTEDPEVAAEVIPKLLLNLYPEHYEEWNARSSIGVWGAFARPYVEQFILGWRTRLSEGRGHMLAHLVGWPGFPPDSPVDRARMDIIRTMAHEPRDCSYRTEILDAAVGALVPTQSGDFFELMKACIRGPNSFLLHPRLTHRSNRPLTNDALHRLLKELWTSIDGDPSVTPESRAEVAYSLAETSEHPESMDTVAPASVAQARAWVALDSTSPATVKRSVARTVERFLTVHDDASTRARLANLWLSLGDPSRAADAAETAVPGLEDAAEIASANLILGRAATILGRAKTAQRALRAVLDAREAGLTRDERADVENAILGFRVTARIPGLELRRFPMGVKGPQIWWRRCRDLFFGVSDDGRLDVFDLTSGRQELLAVMPGLVETLAPLDRNTVVVANAENRVALYQRGRIVPGWERRLPPWNSVFLALGHSVILASGNGQRVDALDLADGHVLWSRVGVDVWRGAPGWMPPERSVVLVAPPSDSIQEGTTLVVDERSGNFRWSAPLYPTAMAANRDVLVVAPKRGSEVHAFNLANGMLQWTAQLPPPAPGDYDNIAALAAATDGSLVYMGAGRELRAHDASTGALRWERAWEPPRLQKGYGFRHVDSVDLLPVRGGVLAEIGWHRSWTGIDNVDNGKPRDLLLLTDSGDMVFQETRPATAYESRVQPDGDSILLDHFGPVGRHAFELWNLKGVPRRGRRAPRLVSRPSNLATLEKTDRGLAGEADGVPIRIAPGLIQTGPTGHGPAVRLTIDGIDPSAPACGLETVSVEPGRPTPDARPVVRCPAVRSGVDLDVLDVGTRTEILLRLSPGQDPRDVTFVVDGLDELRMDEDGGLRASTTVGALHVFPALASQESESNPIPVAARFAIRPNEGVQVEVGEHEPRQPLLIHIEMSFDR